MNFSIASVNKFYHRSEEEVVPLLLSQLSLSEAQKEKIHQSALKYVQKARNTKKKAPFLERLMTKYNLSSKEGLALMSLAEALIRIPDQRTAFALIQDKLRGTDFKNDFLNYENLSDKALAKFLSFASGFLMDSTTSLMRPVKKQIQALSTPLIVQGARTFIRLLANQFVIGETIQEALAKSKKNKTLGYSHSFDMLGEAAYTAQDAQRYFEAYLNAIHAVRAFEDPSSSLRASISVKLSALHPRYNYAQRERVLEELPRFLIPLAQAAAQGDIDLTIDAEGSDQLELSLELFEKMALSPHLSRWQGLGLAVQAYQKRAPAVIDWLSELAKRSKRRFKVRLVKGAYWDTEIKVAQEKGLSDYPVFTRKKTTDVSYLVCAKKLLDTPACFYPQFATHNAHTVSSILELASEEKDFEFQCLFGMGKNLYTPLLKERLEVPVRLYAPVGGYKDLLPYLVRRLLENGANSSFVNELARDSLDINHLIEDPFEATQKLETFRHPQIPLPQDLYKDRLNSRGIDLSNQEDLQPLMAATSKEWEWKAGPILGGKKVIKQKCTIVQSPIDGRPLGQKYQATAEELENALSRATKAHQEWDKTPVFKRASILEKAADLLENNYYEELISLCILEGGKTIPDAVSEVREAIDFCRYYAQQGREKLTEALTLPGPTGEQNSLRLRGRGAFLCISPWNFPLAIFLGQITAALVSGNTVLAKPAGQTPLIATRAIEILLQAGIPKEVLHFIPASGQLIQETILTDNRVAGVCFTGSTETAWSINKTLAQRRGPIIPFIAETGGQNAMIVDSTALPEQVVQDVLTSAFQSAGQRCSALRLLLLQDNIADKVLTMLQGAMQELKIGNPCFLSTDVGPVIDRDSQHKLEAHIRYLEGVGKCLYQVPIPTDLMKKGPYVGPCAYEIPSIDLLAQEHFGPILHIKRFKGNTLHEVVEEINNLGFGLTFGLHTRLQSRGTEISNHLNAGNVYVNRNMIGAVVGVHPFGGQGLSGTGPKAGGPHYLYRFVHEQTISINTTAQGGNSTLMAAIG